LDCDQGPPQQKLIECCQYIIRNVIALHLLESLRLIWFANVIAIYLLESLILIWFANVIAIYLLESLILIWFANVIAIYLLESLILIWFALGTMYHVELYNVVLENVMLTRCAFVAERVVQSPGERKEQHCSRDGLHPSQHCQQQSPAGPGSHQVCVMKFSCIYHPYYLH
jgi:hypothetical protein